MIVFDIETVPDLSIWQPPEDNPNAFPPPIVCRPVVISCVDFDAQHMPARIGSIRTENANSLDVSLVEREVLEKWASYLLRSSRGVPLVSWNGRRFDLPVLLQRCFARGIRHPNPLEKGSYGYRYDCNMHADLMDMLGVYGAARACSLDVTAKAIGLPGKSFESGSSVKELFAAGEYDRICTYCETDAFQTAGVWLRWLLTVGTLDLEGYQTRANALLEKGSERLPGEFMALIDKTRFLYLGPIFSEPIPESQLIQQLKDQEQD